jgi:hypothetical protein
VKKCCVFYGTSWLNPLFKRACHWMLSWASCVLLTSSHPVSLCFIILLFSRHPCHCNQ